MVDPLLLPPPGTGGERVVDVLLDLDWPAMLSRRNRKFIEQVLNLLGGFQLLHAVYVVERFLENLVKRHCQFHIAFFEGTLNRNILFWTIC
jgi:hypothetical protein